MPKYHFLSTQSLATGVTAVSVHSFRRCTLQPHGDSWLYFPSVTHCSQGHEVLLAMILIGEGCHCMDGHCPCNSCDFPKAINSRLCFEAGSLWHKVKETELADWWCCVQEKEVNCILNCELLLPDSFISHVLYGTSNPLTRTFCYGCFKVILGYTDIEQIFVVT